MKLRAMRKRLATNLFYFNLVYIIIIIISLIEVLDIEHKVENELTVCKIKKN